MRRIVLLLTTVLVATLAAPAAAAPPGDHSPNLRWVKNIGYAPHNGGTKNYGTDIEFFKRNGREYAAAGSYRNGLQLVDITVPGRAFKVGRYDCGVTQGDPQIFKRDGRTYVGYTSDTYGDGTSTCYEEAAALGFDVLKPNGSGKNGTFIADITDPTNPRTVSFVAVAQGSHNHTIHPNGRHLYNSNSDLITSYRPAIEVYNISNFLKPKLVTELELPTRPGLGTESHDITFNRSGSRAYSAALSQGVIIDTSRPWQPKVLTSWLDPAINVWHQADPFTLTDTAGRKRDFVVVEDEFVGAVQTGQCPNGGVHVYEVTGELEQEPVKVGYWNINDVRPTDDPMFRCTAHVFDIHEKAQIMTIAFYNGGVRVVDLSGLTGISVGGQQITGAGMKELAYYKMDGGESWAAKSPAITRGKDFFLYSNDIERGLDIFRFMADAEPSGDAGTWLNPTEAMKLAQSRGAVPEDYQLFCLSPQARGS